MNQHALTSACIDSLLKATYKNIEIIVVDQNSHDQSSEILRNRYPSVTIIANTNNTGFTGGNNQGMKISTGKYFLLLNNDTEVEPGFLEPLVDLFEQDPTIGAASPLIRFYHSPDHIQYAGGPETIDLVRGRNIWRGANETIPSRYTKAEATTAAHGAAFFIRRDVVHEIGMLDEAFFIYYEEYDWSLRVRKAGYSIFFVPESVIFHKESMTVKKDNPFRMRQMARNRIWLTRKHASFLTYSISLLYLWVISIPINTFRHLQKRRTDLSKALLVGSFLGFFYKTESM
jgi:GT2 family glycosyltransferase